MKEILFQKLTSRKFWVGLILVIVGVIMCVTGDITHGMTVAGIGAVTYLGCETVTDVMGIIFKKETAETEEVSKEE